MLTLSNSLNSASFNVVLISSAVKANGKQRVYQPPSAAKPRFNVILSTVLPSYPFNVAALSVVELRPSNVMSTVVALPDFLYM